MHLFFVIDTYVVCLFEKFETRIHDFTSTFVYKQWNLQKNTKSHKHNIYIDKLIKKSIQPSRIYLKTSPILRTKPTRL